MARVTTNASLKPQLAASNRSAANGHGEFDGSRIASSYASAQTEGATRAATIARRFIPALWPTGKAIFFLRNIGE